jgi:hypothetical protein
MHELQAALFVVEGEEGAVGGLEGEAIAVVF